MERDKGKKERSSIGNNQMRAKTQDSKTIARYKLFFFDHVVKDILKESNG